MPAIPVTTPLGFIGLGFVVLGVFLFLAGLSIISTPKINVRPGKLTMASGGVAFVLGLAILLFSEPAYKRPGVSAPTPNQYLTQAMSWPVVLQDAFTDNAAGWPLATLDDDAKATTQQIAGGIYIWKLTSRNAGNWWWMMAPVDAYADFSFAAKVRRVPGQGEATAGYGLVFRRQAETAYRYLINDARQFTVQAYDHAREPKVRDLISLTPSSLIRPGSFNELRVIAIGPQMLFFINGRHAGSADDAAFSTGSVGFAVLPDANSVGQEIEYDFDDFDLRQMPAP